MIEQQKRQNEQQRRTDDVRTRLQHQMSLERHKLKAENEMVAEEARQVADDLAAFHADMARVDAERKRKSDVQKADREAMLQAKAARAAAEVRLRKLEDDELTAHLEREQAKDRERQAAKQRANAEYHATTARANIEARAQREATKKSEWAEEQRLNETWKAMLDKQENDRNEQYAKLRSRIHAMQRNYEYTAGAEIAARNKAEEERRDAYIAAEETRLEALDVDKRQKRKDAIASTTKHLFSQMEARREGKRQERAEEREYAASVRADAEKEAIRDAEKKALARARQLSQQTWLNDQIKEQKGQLGRDPGASEMTALEASINRGLLVSIVQHKYPNPHVLN